MGLSVCTLLLAASPLFYSIHCLQPKCLNITIHIHRQVVAAASNDPVADILEDDKIITRMHGARNMDDKCRERHLQVVFHNSRSVSISRHFLAGDQDHLLTKPTTRMEAYLSTINDDRGRQVTNRCRHGEAIDGGERGGSLFST